MMRRRRTTAISLQCLYARRCGLADGLLQQSLLCAQIGRAREFFKAATGVFCFDATHGLCDSGHQLVNLLFVTDNKSGVIVASAFVPHDHDHMHLVAFLKWIQAQVGGAWKPFCFMTDDDNKGERVVAHCALPVV